MSLVRGGEEHIARERRVGRLRALFFFFFARGDFTTLREEKKREGSGTSVRFHERSFSGRSRFEEINAVPPNRGPAVEGTTELLT